MKKPTLSAAANVALIVAAVAAVWNTQGTGAAARAPQPEVPENWEQELAAGVQVGPADAPLQIVELMDFQCPFCRGWSARLDSLLAEHSESVRISFHHWPLSNHPHALPAAVAAECAQQQGAFLPYARELFAAQDSIGVRPWKAFAETAGVPDLGAFEACAALPADSFPRIKYGRDLANRVGATGTPTVWINGQMRRPTLAELRELVQEAGR